MKEHLDLIASTRLALVSGLSRLGFHNKKIMMMIMIMIVMMIIVVIIIIDYYY